MCQQIKWGEKLCLCKFRGCVSKEERALIKKVVRRKWRRRHWLIKITSFCWRWPHQTHTHTHTSIVYNRPNLEGHLCSICSRNNLQPGLFSLLVIKRQTEDRERRRGRGDQITWTRHSVFGRAVIWGSISFYWKTIEKFRKCWTAGLWGTAAVVFCLKWSCMRCWAPPAAETSPRHWHSVNTAARRDTTLIVATSLNFSQENVCLLRWTVSTRRGWGNSAIFCWTLAQQNTGVSNPRLLKRVSPVCCHLKEKCSFWTFIWDYWNTSWRHVQGVDRLWD